MFIHQGTNKLISSKDVVTNLTNPKTISSVQIPTCSILLYNLYKLVNELLLLHILEMEIEFSLHQGDIGHMKLLSVDIDTGHHPCIAQKPYMLPFKHTQWVREKLEMLEKLELFHKASPLGHILLLLYQRKPNQVSNLRNVYV